MLIGKATGLTETVQEDTGDALSMSIHPGEDLRFARCTNNYLVKLYLLHLLEIMFQTVTIINLDSSFAEVETFTFDPWDTSSPVTKFFKWLRQ